MFLPRDKEETWGKILDVELGIAEIPDKIEDTVTGIESRDP
jgi:hypothetical protein